VKEVNIDWDNPAEIEKLLSSEGLGVIEPIQGQNDSKIALEIYLSSPAISLLPEKAIKNIVSTFDDGLDAAIAISMLPALAQDLELDGTVGEAELDLIDDIVLKITSTGLFGITLDDLVTYGNINTDLGGLNTLFEIRALLEGAHGGYMDGLREIAGTAINKLEVDDELNWVDIDEEVFEDFEDDDDDEDEDDTIIDGDEEFEL